MVIEQAAIGKFITAIARLKETFAELARSLRLQAGVKSVVQWLDIPLLGDGYRIELYTDAEMSDGRALGWRLEVAWSGQNWIVEGGVTINDATGHTLTFRGTRLHYTKFRRLFRCDDPRYS